VCNPEEAIRGLAIYVVITIVAGARMQDMALFASLPEVLEPFAPLSPVLHAIWQNAVATRESGCENRPEAARERWLAVLDALSRTSTAELMFVAQLRTAIVYGIGSLEARMGLASAEQRARMLDDDPLQAVSAMSLRKLARLHQGDFAAAERFRKDGERLALHADVQSMFSDTLQTELIAYALASDLTGLRQVSEKIDPLAARFAGWQPYKHLADGYLEQTRERPQTALAAFERGLASTGTARGSAWPRLEAARIEALVRLGRAEEAKQCGERALSVCAQHGIHAAAFMIRRALAMAEARLGEYEGASRRLDAVIADMIALGVSGLELGATYETRTRIAIWFADEAAIVEFARHTAREYRYGEGSSLGARYERLMDEARATGASALPQLLEFQTKLTTSHLRGASAASLVAQALAETSTPEERAQRVLRLLCQPQGGRAGHLYLRTARGLERVASLGEHAPDRSLDDFVRRYAAQQLDAADSATAIESSHSLQLTSATTWLDGRGTSHHPLLMMAEVDGAELCVGAAIIEADDGTRFAPPTSHLLDAIGEYLLRAGDIHASARDAG
jgi:tetratricopeptide (TPR) repeat protein